MHAFDHSPTLLRHASRFTRLTLCALIGCATISTGCMGRLFREGVGLAGARGKVMPIVKLENVQQYHGLIVEPTANPDQLELPEKLLAMLHERMEKVADDAEMEPVNTPTLILKTTILHYETGGVVDQAIGPLEEIIIRARLIESDSGREVAVATLISRSKATTSSGTKNLCDGMAKALKKWLKIDSDEDDDEKNRDKSDDESSKTNENAVMQDDGDNADDDYADENNNHNTDDSNR